MQEGPRTAHPPMQDRSQNMKLEPSDVCLQYNHPRAATDTLSPPMVLYYLEILTTVIGLPATGLAWTTHHSTCYSGPDTSPATHVSSITF